MFVWAQQPTQRDTCLAMAVYGKACRKEWTQKHMSYDEIDYVVKTRTSFEVLHLEGPM